MKIKLLSCLLVLLFALPLSAAPPKGRLGSAEALNVDNGTFINTNKILMFVTNHGNFGRDLGDRFGYDYGTFFPYTAVESIDDGSAVASPFYAGGLWIGGVDSVSGDTLVVVSEYSSEYVPGPMADSTFIEDNADFHVYKLYADSTFENANADWTNWPEDQGAPMAIDTIVEIIDSAGGVILDADTTYSDPYPGLIGDQMCWSVFNDANPAQHDNNNGETEPLGLEVRQSVFGWNRTDALGYCVFVRLRVYNRGERTLDNCYFSLWSDPDLGLAGDDLVGCDTTLDLGFVYNANNSDQKYTDGPPPALGLDFFQGPLEFTGNMDDVGLMWNGAKFPGYRNLGMASFNKYINGTDPDNYVETYWFMEGLDAKNNGAAYSDGLAYRVPGDPTDPTEAAAYLDFAPDDRRMMQTTGPITFRPGDSTEIVAAMVVGRGGDRKSSVNVMKFYDETAQAVYDANWVVPDPPASPIVTVAELDGQIALTWTDTSEVVPGDYGFEGYTVYQGEGPSGPWTRIANYDLTNGVLQIQDNVVDPESGALEIRTVKFGTDGGLRRYFIVEEDYLTGTPLRNVSEYYFKVEAYSFLFGGKPATLTSANRTPIRVVPQAQVPDIQYEESVGDLPAAAHSTGSSDGSVAYEVMDPRLLTGHTYEVVFADTLAIVIDTIVTETGDPLNPVDTTFDSTNVAWFLIDTDLGDTLLSWQTDQSATDDQLVTDGFVAKVTGPAVGFSSFAVVANAGGALSPFEPGALTFDGFPVPTINDPDGYITGAQQTTGTGNWGLHVADPGGTCDHGENGDYSAFQARSNMAVIGEDDYEMRFTGSNDDPGTGGGYAIEMFNDSNVFWVPFELWNIGRGTPNDPSDDYRLIPYIVDYAGDSLQGDDIFAVESWGCRLDTFRIDTAYYDSVGDSLVPEDTVLQNFGGLGEHSGSGADNDPYTDLVYWINPSDMSAGSAGYDAAETAMLAGTYPANEASLSADTVFQETVLLSWNGGYEPPFNMDVPEMGTVFRIVTAITNSPEDVFSFTTLAPSAVTGTEEMLDAIKAVPNPFYLFGGYDPAVGNYQIKFHHLPELCTITIYNLSGELINTIEKDDASTSIATWNVQTRENLPVASGIYIYVVDAPGFGTKIGKMAVFTEDQVLDIY